MASKFIIFRHNIEKKRLDIIIEGLGAQEKFCEKAKILAVNGIFTPIDFENRDGFFAVDFVARWVLRWTFELMSPGHIVRVHILETKLAYIEHSVSAVLLWVRRGIPSLNLKAAKVDALDLAWWTGDFLASAFVLSLAFGSSLELPLVFGFLASFIEARTIRLKW